MRLQVRGVDHQLIRSAAFGRERLEDAVEHAEAAPADEAVVDRFVRSITRRCIAPAQAIPDHEDDAADDTAIIDPRNTVRQGKVRLDPAHLRRRQQHQITHADTSSPRH